MMTTVTFSNPLTQKSKHRSEVQKFMYNYRQRLIETGMPIDEAKRISRAVAKSKMAKPSPKQDQSVKAREMQSVYWRRLIEWGVPIDEAKEIAKAIAHYEFTQSHPTAPQRNLIQRYCRFICRSGLWQADLLLSAA